MNMKYPVGIQDFASLRSGGYAYADKTAFAFQMVSEGKYYFLSRPRRFGKSLLLSTLRYYFEGRTELFKGLAIEKLEKEWKRYPVLCFNFCGYNPYIEDCAEQMLISQMCRYEAIYGDAGAGTSAADRLAILIQNAFQATGEKVVLLFDEYDKPLLEALGDKDKEDKACALLNTIYSVLNTEDKNLCFCMITGVSKFSQAKVFSGINNLRDLSMDERYDAICGITEKELHAMFDDGVAALAETSSMDKNTCYEFLRKRYGGYRFAAGKPGIYNGDALMRVLLRRHFEDFWFETGTPTFLVKAMRRKKFDIEAEICCHIPAEDLKNIEATGKVTLPILFMTGYLTIQDYHPDQGTYTLWYPNDDVRRSYIRALVPYCS